MSRSYWHGPISGCFAHNFATFGANWNDKPANDEDYPPGPFLTRLHSGEAFGDWGLVFGTAWGLALVALLVSGLVIYLTMRKPGRTGLGRLFW